MNIAFKRPYFSIGLDIGTSAIKVAKLKLFKNTAELAGFESEPIQSDLTDTLKRLAQKHGLETVNLSVAGASTLIRYVNFPKMNKDELAKALKFEAQKHIPFAISEINVDACILKEDLPDNKILVLIAAVKNDLLNQRLQLIKEAGLKVNIVDIDSLALFNAFNFSYANDESIKHKAVALINIGAAMTNLNILEDDIPKLSRDIQIAGNSFTQKIIDTFQVDFKASEEMKLNPDKGDSEKIHVAVESALSHLAGEIRISFDYYESQSTSSVSKIFLSGGGSMFSGLKDMLANLLGIEVVYWDPLKQISLSPDIDSEKAKAAANNLHVAIGLALRR